MNWFWSCKPGGKFDRPDLTLQHLETLPFIAAQGNTARRDIEDSALLRIGVVRRYCVLEFGHGEAMMRAVCTDVGLAFLFKSSIVDEIERGTLKILALKDLR